MAWPRFLDRRSEQWLLGLMLLVLMLAMRSDLGSALSRSLLTAHIGLFFLWQPIWQRDQRLAPDAALTVLAFAAAFVALAAWWLVCAWLLVLVGIVAGRSFSTREERYIYMLALAFLVSALLVEGVPQLFELQSIGIEVTEAFKLALPLVAIAILLIPPPSAAPRPTFPIDFFRGVTIALLTALLAVSSVLLTYEQDIEYPVAVMLSLLALSAFLLVISWLVTPGTGSNLGTLWEKSLLNIGTPFESWLAELADLASRPYQSTEFLEAAMEALAELPWISGVSWSTGQDNGRRGADAHYRTVLETQSLTVVVYTARPVGPALLLHCRLLVQVLAYFYSAKTREHELAEAAHLQAVYETGARLTHDIKNLLQSLQVITGGQTAAESTPRQQARLALLDRQLPQITRRLQAALDKLQQPQAGTVKPIALKDWWSAARARWEGPGITFDNAVDDPGAAATVPGEVFDSVLDNLLDNARVKRQREPDIAVSACLEGSGRNLRLQVSDSGSPLPPDLAARLFEHPVESHDGLGIGLYQSARLLAAAGYDIAISVNRPGRVTFEVGPRPVTDQPVES